MLYILASLFYKSSFYKLLTTNLFLLLSIQILALLFIS